MMFLAMPTADNENLQARTNLEKQNTDSNSTSQLMFGLMSSDPKVGHF